VQINIKKLKEKGITVRLIDEFGTQPKGLQGITQIEVFPENGRPLPDEVLAGIRKLLSNQEYADALLEGLVHRVQTFQILEAIESTED